MGFPADTDIFQFLSWFFPEICAEQEIFCENIFFFIGGCNTAANCDPGNMNLSQVPVYSGHIGGASVQCLVHYLQLARVSTFQYYDYGPEGNMQHYNTTTPPDYDLTKVNVPVAIFNGDNDNFADPVDVQRLEKILPNLVFSHDENEYEHLDFVWAIDADEKIYPSIITLLQKYNV